MKQTALLVLLVEDDMDLAATLSDYLTLENIECDHAFNGRAGLDQALNNQYDLILLDLTLPQIDGLSVSEQLRAQHIQCPILMLTARDAISDRVAGFEAGADDYLIKPFAFEELVVRIRALVRRSKAQSNQVKIADLTIDFDQQLALRNGRRLKLSPTGWTLLEQLARNSPKTLSREQLERAVWGDQVPNSNSLKVHIYKLRRQIQRPHESPLLNTVAGSGYGLRQS